LEEPFLEGKNYHLRHFPLNPSTLEIVTGLFNGYFLNISTEVSTYLGLESISRLKDIWTYISTHRTIPGKMIFLKDNSLHDIVDGCHRLTCFYALNSGRNTTKNMDSQISAWIGEPNAS
jgi:hypothetical protein